MSSCNILKIIKEKWFLHSVAFLNQWQLDLICWSFKICKYIYFIVKESPRCFLVAKALTPCHFLLNITQSFLSMIFFFELLFVLKYNYECFRGVRSWTWGQCSRLNQRPRHHSQPSTTADYWSTYWDSTPGRRGETTHRHMRAQI